MLWLSHANWSLKSLIHLQCCLLQCRPRRFCYRAQLGMPDNKVNAYAAYLTKICSVSPRFLDAYTYA